MRRGVVWMLMTLLTGLLIPEASAFVHPGISNTEAHYTLMRQKVLAGASPWKDTYNAIPSRLTYTPSVPPAITCSAGMTCMEALPLLNDATAAYEAALQWVVTGEIAYATKAIEILNAWATANPPISGASNRLLAVSQYSPRMAMAAEILKHLPESGWLSGAQTTFAAFVDARIIPNLAPTNLIGTDTEKNHVAALGAWAQMAWGVYRENQSLYDDGLASVQALIAFYIGRFGHAVLDGFTYETCAGPEGFGGLSGGDLVHTITALTALAAAAEISKHQGTADLYAHLDTTDGFGLRTALLAHAQWFYYPSRVGSTAAAWPCQVAFPGLVLGEQEVFTPASWHALYNHYRDAVFLSNSHFQGNKIATTSALPWDGLTHAYTEALTPARYAFQTGTGTACTELNPCTFAEATSQAPAGSIIRIMGTITATCDNCLPSGLSATQPTILESATKGTPIPVGLDGVLSTPGLGTLNHSTGTVLSIRPTRQHIVVRQLNITTTGGSSNPAVVIGDTVSGTAKAQDITLEDLEIQAPTRTGTAACGRSHKNTTARLKVSRLRVHRCGPVVDFADLSPTVHGLDLQGDDLAIEDSDIYDNAARGLQVDDAAGTTANPRTQVRRNRIWGNGGIGSVIGGGMNQVVSRNAIYANGSHGLKLSARANQITAHALTLHDNSRQVATSFSGLDVDSGMTGIVRNLISIGHPGPEYDISPSGASIACTDNLSGDASAPASCTGTDLNAVATDVWVDPTHATLASRDYHLKAGSVAIDGGTTTICTAADVTANRCSPEFTLSSFQGTAPDQGAYERDAPSTGVAISRYLLNNSVLDDVGPNDGINVNVTFDATNTIEGSHSALFDAAGDHIQTTLTGFNRASFTIGVSARATAFGTSRPTYLYGHSSDYVGGTYKDRIQIYLTATGSLAIGLGASHTTMPGAYAFNVNTFERIVLVVQEGAVSGSGTARLYVGGVLRSTASYSGLTQTGLYADLGNNGATQDQSWLGQLDAVVLANYAWSPTEVLADCATYCVASQAPFDPLLLANCTLGPSVANVITCEALGQPDPARCNTLTDFRVSYDTIAQTTTGCTLTGANPAQLRLTVAADATATTVIELLYLLETDPDYIVVNLLAPPVFDPLRVQSCSEDASGINITCAVEGAPDPGVCFDLRNFRLTEACVPVPLVGCSIALNTLTLQRAVQPASATVPLALEIRDAEQVTKITNGFIAGTPPAE